MERWSRWSEIYCGGKRRCGSLCSQGTLAAHFEGISKGWNRTALSLVGLSWKDDKQGVPGGLPPLLGMCSIQLTRHTDPIQFTIDARCRSIEICYGATG